LKRHCSVSSSGAALAAGDNLADAAGAGGRLRNAAEAVGTTGAAAAPDLALPVVAGFNFGAAGAGFTAAGDGFAAVAAEGGAAAVAGGVSSGSSVSFCCWRSIARSLATLF
jgi:hypothetical protein